MRACAVEMHLDISPKPFLSKNYQEKMPGPTIATHTLCEPAQSKCIWMRLDIAQQALTREFAGKMPQTKSEDHTGDQTVCEPAQLKCARDISQESLCARIDKKNAGDHDRDPHFVQACAVPHTKIGDHTGDHTFVRACAVEMHLDISQVKHFMIFMRESTGKMPQASWSILIKHRPLHSQ